jgi:Domain of unknown function (DUF4432)
MRVVFLENALLRIGILVDRGSDIFEFHYKPMDLDPLLRLPKGIVNPVTNFSQMRDTQNQFEDYYYGGWQEILPNSQPFRYRNASLGQHGEVSLISWKYAILKDTQDEVALKVWTRPLRMPLLIEKTLSLKKGEAVLRISEQLQNEGNTHLDIMWGHHIAFGLPFLEEGATIETNAKSFVAEAAMPAPRRFISEQKFDWPIGFDAQGNRVDAHEIPPVNAGQYSELCCLDGYTQKSHYTINSKKYKVGFNLEWDGDLFRYLWLWEERYATKDFPWWGQCYTVALEPWTSPWTNESERAIGEGHWLRIAEGETIKTSLMASILNHQIS